MAAPDGHDATDAHDADVIDRCRGESERIDSLQHERGPGRHHHPRTNRRQAYAPVLVSFGAEQQKTTEHRDRRGGEDVERRDPAQGCITDERRNSHPCPAEISKFQFGCTHHQLLGRRISEVSASLGDYPFEKSISALGTGPCTTDTGHRPWPCIDFAGDGTAREPPQDRRHAQPDDVTFLLSTTLAWYRSAVTAPARRVASSTRRGSRNLAAHPQRTLRGAAAVVGSTMRYTRPVFTTRSPVMTKRSTRRRVAVLDVPMSGFEAAAAACGGSINDAPPAPAPCSSPWVRA
ncbi:hypothetical protein FXW78_43150 [Rhodococcus opacus]|nr:hypothetical protein [Rhodococcus opacus]